MAEGVQIKTPPDNGSRTSSTFHDTFQPFLVKAAAWGLGIFATAGIAWAAWVSVTLVSIKESNVEKVNLYKQVERLQEKVDDQGELITDLRILLERIQP